MPKAKRKSTRGLNSGASNDKMLEEAFAYLEKEDGKRAEQSFRKLLAGGADSSEIRMGLAESLMLQGKMQDGENEFENAMQLAESEEEKAQLLALRASSVLTMGFPEEAARTFFRIDDEFPRYTARFSSALVLILTEQGREKEAWKWFEGRLAKPEELPAVDAALYCLAWIELMFEMDRVEFKDKLARLFKQAGAKITSPEERDLLVDALSANAARFSEDMMFREAVLYVDLALFIDPSSRQLAEFKEVLREFVKVQIEIDRMSRDDKLFPLVTLRAVDWFYEEEHAEEMLAQLPEEFVESLIRERRLFADGIKRLRKKYPATYAMFEEDWEALYNELVGKSGNVVQFPQG